MLKLTYIFTVKKKEEDSYYGSFWAFQLRPTPEKAGRVAALPYDVVTEEEARETGDKNPFSFLHVDRAEIDLPEGTDPYDSIVYEKQKKIFLQWRRRDLLLG